MTDELVPSNVKEFILAHIESIAQLEALLLLRANADHPWDASAMAGRLYIGERQGQEILERLCSQGLVSHENKAFRYAPVAHKAALIDGLAEAYAKHLIPTTNIIHQRPGRIREFADAFKIRREP